MEIPLPANVTLRRPEGENGGSSRRGTPSTLNTPALDPVLMLDGRDPNLEAQAAGAIRSHYQVTRQIAPGRPPPHCRASEGLPSVQFPQSCSTPSGARNRACRGRTEPEKRGRLFFEDFPFAPGKKEGVCALCHSGPMLNTTNRFVPFQPPGVTVLERGRFGVQHRRLNPVRNFLFQNP